MAELRYRSTPKYKKYPAKADAKDACTRAYRWNPTTAKNPHIDEYEVDWPRAGRWF